MQSSNFFFIPLYTSWNVGCPQCDEMHEKISMVCFSKSVSDLFRLPFSSWPADSLGASAFSNWIKGRVNENVWPKFVRLILRNAPPREFCDKTKDFSESISPFHIPRAAQVSLAVLFYVLEIENNWISSSVLNCRIRFARKRD